MASQSLYRKWRSQTFDELIGQEHVVQTLRNALVEERVAHAYLFTGPRGVGKTTMARLLAKAVNCSDPDIFIRPCGHCASCVAIAEGRAVDVIEMDAASHTSVDDAREIIERVQFRPSDARYKVYVIDECHMLSTAAFNALLKTLEEPPDHAIFVLATTEVHKVPATILSRCQRFTFTRHSIAATSAHLRQIAEAEGLSLAPGAPEAIARAATGSMRDALSVLEQLASFAQGQIDIEQVNSLLGMTAAAEVDALVEALLNGDIGAALRAVNGVADQGADIRQFTRDLVERLRALMLLRAAGDHALVDIGDHELQAFEGWAQRAETATLVGWIKLFSGLDYQLRTTPYGHLPLELAVVEALVAPPLLASQPAAARPAPTVPRATPPRPAMAANPRTAELGTRAQAPPPTAPPAGEEGRKQADSQPQPAPIAPTEVVPVAQEATTTTWESIEPSADIAVPAKTNDGAQLDVELEAEADELADVVAQPAPPPVATAPIAVHEAAIAANADFTVLERIEALWNDVIRDVRPKSPAVQGLLRGAKPIDVEGNTLVILCTSIFHKSNLETPQNRKIVEDVLSKQLGITFAIRCTTEGKVETHNLRDQIREARKDELVRAAINIFEAHIVDIEAEE